MSLRSTGRERLDRISRRDLFRGSLALVGGTVAGAAVGMATTRVDPEQRPRIADTRPRARTGSTLDVCEFGAVGDGRTRDTEAIQGAIDAAGRVAPAVVRLPAGAWLCGGLQLRSHVTIELAAGAVLLASPHDADFAPREVLPFRTGSDVETTDFAHALLAGRDLVAVAITGAGTIDMNRRERFGPKPIALKGCRLVTVRGITILHSPNYCVSLGGCDDIVVDGVTIREAYADGIDPDCCRRLRVANCDIESDDDALCLKSSFILGRRGVTEDVLVSNCRLRSSSNCFKLGTESTGDFRRVVVSDCVFAGLTCEHRDLTRVAEGGGIAIETVDGGTIDGVMVSNVVMTDVPAPLFIRLGSRGRDPQGPVPGHLRNVSITGILATGATGTCSITGLRGHPVEGIRLDSVRITASGGAAIVGDLDVPECEGHYPQVTMFGTLPAFGLYLRHARDATLRNVEFGVEHGDRRPAVIADDVADLRVARLVGGAGAAPAVWLNDVRGAVLQEGPPPNGGGGAVRVTGENTVDVLLLGSMDRARLEVAPEIAPGAVRHVAAESVEERAGVAGAVRPPRTS